MVLLNTLELHQNQSLIYERFFFVGVILAPLIQFLLYTYGYQGTLLICGALMFHFTPFGSLCHPVEWHENVYQQTDVENKEGGVVGNDETSKMEELRMLQRKISREDSKIDRRVVEIIEHHDHEEYQSMCSLDKIGKEVAIQGEGATKELAKAKSLPQRIANACVKAFDLKLLCYFPFLFLALLSMATITALVTNQVFLSSLAEDKGFTPQETGLLLMVINCVDIPSKESTVDSLHSLTPFPQLRAKNS